LHIWDRMTPVDEVMRAFDDLVRQGKVLYKSRCGVVP
jgi:aryl-alcohol dehydrogenase-like predicted oxidoreductase